MHAFELWRPSRLASLLRTSGSIDVGTDQKLCGCLTDKASTGVRTSCTTTDEVATPPTHMTDTANYETT